MALYATLNENNHICIYPDNEDFLGVQRMEFRKCLKSQIM